MSSVHKKVATHPQASCIYFIVCGCTLLGALCGLLRSSGTDTLRPVRVLPSARDVLPAEPPKILDRTHRHRSSVTSKCHADDELGLAFNLKLTCTPLAVGYSIDDLMNRVLLFTDESINQTRREEPEFEPLVDLLELVNRLPRTLKRIPPIAVRLTDDTRPSPFPILAKARRVGQENVTLLPLNHRRHFNKTYANLIKFGDPIPYDLKLPIAIWRGSSTGMTSEWQHNEWIPNKPPTHTRRHLIERWAQSDSPMVDVGLTEIVQEAIHYKDIFAKYVKPAIAEQDQLKYRYLVAVEGNDVATSLKWMLASNSTVMMPTPTMESWFRESCLIPWIHYVPILYDTSDLLQKIAFCEKNLEICERIGVQGSVYVREWFGRVNEIMSNGAKRLQAYIARINIRVDNVDTDKITTPMINCAVKTI